MNAEELTSLTVDEQKEELENLETHELEELKTQEKRRTAVGNIESELSNREPEQEETSEPEPSESTLDKPENQEEDTSDEEIDERSEIEAKVDYLIEKCKTTSKQGFKDYYEN